jgi:chromosome segregation ATPase
MADDNEPNNGIPAETEPAPDRTTELERRLAERDEAMSQARDRIAELEQLVADLEAEVADLKQSGFESEQKLAEMGQHLSQAVASYRARVIESNPEVPAELIEGDTIETIDSSLQSAKALISKVREGLEAEIRTARIPAGAPQRAPIDLSALSPREKIQHGIGGSLS